MLELIFLIIIGAAVSTAATLLGVSFWTMALYIIGPIALLLILFKLGSSPMLESFSVGAIVSFYCALMFEWHLAICIAIGLVLGLALFSLMLFRISYLIRTLVLVAVETAICVAIIKQFTNDLIWIAFFGVIYGIASLVAHLAGRDENIDSLSQIINRNSETHPENETEGISQIIITDD